MLQRLRLYLLGMTVVLLASQVRAQSDFDGNAWVGWHTDIRMMYLVGWVDGRQAGAWEAVSAVAPELRSKWTEDPRIAKLELEVTVGQLLKGVNSFYDDYRNLTISIRSAVGIVVDEATGRMHWSEKDLVDLRRRESTAKGTKP